MPDYLLPCPCGHKSVVSIAHAGETLRCVCGAELQVPSMRGLQALAPAEASVRRAPRRWEDRHRAAFLLCVVAGLCLLAAGYLAITLPARALPPALPAPTEIKTVRDAFRVYVETYNGLEAPQVETPDTKSRTEMLWGIGIAVALAAAAGIGAVLVGIGRSAKVNKNEARRENRSP